MASDWSKDPTEIQQQWYEFFSTRECDHYTPETKEGLEILQRKLGFAIFDKPDEGPTTMNGNTGYSKNKYETIRNVSDAVLCAGNFNRKGGNAQNKLKMAIVFVFVEYEKNLLRYPVFRIMLSADSLECRFVDSDSRIYHGWTNFLQENLMPPGKCCWPADGIYSSDKSKKVNLKWGITPAATEEQKSREHLDRAASWLGARSSAVLLGSLLFPMWGPVVTVAGVCAGLTGVYSSLRSAGTLMDRSVHGQTVNPLRDRQVASSWICTVGSAATMGGGYMTKKAASMAANGQVMGKTSQIVCNALNVTSLATNATGLGFSTFCILERRKQGKMTSLEVFQWTSSVLFFSHTLVSFQTASTIIRDTQNRVIQDFESSLRSNRHKKEFKKLAKHTISDSESPMNGNANIIRSIRKIDNKDDFFAGLVRTRKDLRGHKTVFSENGNIIVDDGLEVHPMKLYDITKDERQNFLSRGREAAQDNTFESNLIACNESSTSNDSLPFDLISLMSNEASMAIYILWTELQEMYPDRLITFSEAVLVVQTVNEITTISCPYKNQNHARWWKLIWKHVNDFINTSLAIYNEGMEVAKQCGTFLNEKRYNIEQGISEASVFVHFLYKASEHFRNFLETLVADINKELEKTNSLKLSC